MTKISHADDGISGELVCSSNDNGQVVSGARRGVWARLAITCDMAIDYIVPIGYEDETGFHYGEMPVLEAGLRLAEHAA
jgi:hypothetical protein